MSFHPDSAPHASQGGYDHPLFAVLGGEAISLDGHLEHGVMSVLHRVAAERGFDITDQHIRLVNDPAEVAGNGGLPVDEDHGKGYN